MADFTLRQLECFVAVVEERSITAAARRLHLTPGAVSVALRDLEDALGVQLAVRRRGEGATITPTGELAYARARATLADAGTLRDLVRSDGLSGPLRIGCFTTISPWMIPAIVAHFDREHPQVDLQFVEGPTSVLSARMRAGELDTVLTYANHLGTGVTAHQITPARLQVVVAPDHPLAELEEIPLRRLENERAILLGIEPAISHVESILRQAGLLPTIAWRSTAVETIRSMVARGLGYTILMGRPYGDHTYDGLPLVYRRISDDVAPNSVVLAVPERMQPSAMLTHLIAFCQGEFADERHFL
ncbi:LysR substrate-binding domain-containing protein [uncultured Leifsonia sp.]|uniref:LysR substrate-binding domain-containing protein n=1 Tax=uncultured Leifsonia sp. TaxID=340359 RepID=UPI0028D49CDD|nr:LysR substrate-binding domain-containing protein [uncultured Leifsonia sp.]